MALGGKLFNASKVNLECAPDAPGIYSLYLDGRFIYIGRADGGSNTIKSRLADHKQGHDGPCTQLFTHYTREVTMKVTARYNELLEHYSRKFGTLPECNLCINGQSVSVWDSVRREQPGEPRHRRPQC